MVREEEGREGERGGGGWREGGGGREGRKENRIKCIHTRDVIVENKKKNFIFDDL